MAYTNVFSVLRPNGATVNASLIDDEIRAVRVDFSERIAGIFGLTALEFAADPIAPKTLTLSTGLTGLASSAAILATARTIGGVSFNGSANITVASATGGFTVTGGTLSAQALTATTGVFSSTVSMTALTATTGVFSSTVSSSGFTGPLTGNVTGNASGSAATLATPRTIGGVSFDGSANITVATATGGFAVTSGAITGNTGLTISSGTSALQAITGTTLVLSSTLSATTGTFSDDLILNVNAKALKGRLGGSVYSLVSLDANGVAQLGSTSGGIPIAIPRLTGIGGGSAAVMGIIYCDTAVAGQFVFFDGVTGARYKLTGTAF